MLNVHNLTGGYQHPIVKDVSFEVKPGQILGILGPNGSGKSTLLKMVSGLLSSSQGTVEIDGKPIQDYRPKELARKMAVLPQLPPQSFGMTVKEAVSLGRYPHQQGLFSSWKTADEEAVMEAMQITQVVPYALQEITTLSGGEQQRVFVAQALAQQAELLLLDEPTNHLDIAHQKQLLDTLKTHVQMHQTAVVIVFHDINLASLYCDHLLLLEKGRVSAYGEPHQVVDKATLEDVYATRLDVAPHPVEPKPQMTLLPEDSEAAGSIVRAADIQVLDDVVLLHTERPMRVVSSAVLNPGFGWYRTLVNRQVEPTYNVNDVASEVKEFAVSRGWIPTETVMQLTAVATRGAVIREYEAPFGSVVILVTAGVGNALDVSRAHEVQTLPAIGTINTWILVNGHMSDEAFIEAMMTATEAKTKALAEEQVLDCRTQTLATGTPTDSLVVAATQSGEALPYGGPITELGKLIGKGVVDCTRQAIRHYRDAQREE
ncbi:ABC transporter ATP-binding protein [Chryseomicrobium excrementi]|uniref:ABC transporter ATP-binding protein n=1 Tax=Chryseomicrobium excrementi TaxID=2041346 RepID=A0A2M9F023_9BACL|nr:adenosylcobinamide amidohydrolase [Chryseomicrobium excrementi]PJK16812.1 ABC transporter ATP-binding protein [Chryseomicrobium excrementi]